MNNNYSTKFQTVAIFQQTEIKMHGSHCLLAEPRHGSRMTMCLLLFIQQNRSFIQQDRSFSFFGKCVL